VDVKVLGSEVEEITPRAFWPEGGAVAVERVSEHDLSDPVLPCGLGLDRWERFYLGYKRETGRCGTV
jgi:hypothetical protein